MSDQELLLGLTFPLRGAFSGCQLRYAQCLSKVILMLVVLVSAIGLHLAAARQCEGEVSHPLTIVHMTWSYGEIKGYPIHRSDDLSREPKEVLSLRRFVVPKMLSPNNSRSANTDILANRNRKVVQSVLRVDVQRFCRFVQLEESLHQQNAYQMKHSVESAFTEHTRHMPSASDEVQDAFNVFTDLYSCDLHHGDDFGIAHTSIFWFSMLGKFEKIVKESENCYGFFGHNPLGLMGYAKPKSEGFFLKANIHEALYQQDKELFNNYNESILTYNLNLLG